MTLQNNLSAEDVKNGANLLGEWFLKGLGTVGKIITAPFTLTGPTSATIYKSKELLAKERTIDLKSEELLGKAMTWMSPLNYGAAIATGNGLNAKKGEEEVASWTPAWLALGRAGELYFGPKAVKGIKKVPINKGLVKTLWNNGKVIQNTFPYNPRNWYRGVGYSALKDAKETGVVRGIHKWNDQIVGPYFGRGYQPHLSAPIIIEGTPESATWVDPFSKTLKKHNTEPIRDNASILTNKGKLDYSKLTKENGFLQEGLSYEGFPMTNGDVNATPINKFTFYKKYPIIGWRKYRFNPIDESITGKANPKYIKLQLSNGKIRLLLPSHTESAPRTLYYKGKNNEILTYQGTSFIKKPLSELSKTTNIAKDLNILGSYTYRTPSSDTKTIDFLKEFFNRLKIQGLEYTRDGLKLSSKNVLIGLPEHIRDYLNENTIERNTRAMRLAGYSERDIQMYKDKVNEEMSKIRVGLYSGEDYNAANSGDFGGFFNDEGNFISVNKDAYLKDPKFTPDYVMKHEGRHLIDYRTGMVNELNKILEEAYDKDFLDIPNHEDAGSLKGYLHMDRERVTTNRDARDVLLSSKGKNLLNEHEFMLYASKKGLSNDMVDFLNKVIKYSQPEDIVNAVENSNGYGKRYIKYLRENNKLTPEKIELLRQAMMHVGGYAAPIVGGIYTLYNQNNNQLLEYRKQGGKMNILEFLKNGGQIRKMQTAAGGALQLTSEELKYYSWINMSPELRRQNRNNRVKAYLLSAPSIGNFWEALLTYIGNRDPKNPHLNAGEAPSASRAINPKLVAQAVLTAGKIVNKAKKYITLTKESTKMLNYPRIGQRYSKSLDIMSDFNPISDLLHLRLPDFTHSSLGLGNKYRAIGGRKALKSIIENGVVAPKGLFSREGKVFWNDGYLDRTYSGRGIFALSYDKTGKAPFYDGGRANSNYIYSSHENPIDFYDEALGLHARIPFTSTYVEIPKTLEGIDKALKMDKIHRYVEKPVHKLYNWGLKPYLGYKLWEHFENKGKEIEDKSKEEKEPLYEYYPYKKGGKIHIKRATFAANARKWNH